MNVMKRIQFSRHENQWKISTPVITFLRMKQIYPVITYHSNQTTYNLGYKAGIV